MGGDLLDRRATGSDTGTVRNWVRRVEIDAGQRPGLTTDEGERLESLVHENRAVRAVADQGEPHRGALRNPALSSQDAPHRNQAQLQCPEFTESPWSQLQLCEIRSARSTPSVS